MTTVAEFDHIWPFDSVTLSHAPCVRCGASYGPDAGMCRVKMPKAQMSLNERLAAAYALDLVADDMRRDSATPAPAHTSALTDAADWLETSMGDWSLLPEWRDHLRVLIAAARERGE